MGGTSRKDIAQICSRHRYSKCKRCSFTWDYISDVGFGYLDGACGWNSNGNVQVPLILAVVTGFAASLTMLTIRERKLGNHLGHKWLDWKELKKNKNFQRFAYLSIIQQFFMSIAWPLFPITIVNVSESDMLLIAYVSVISPIVAFFMRRYTGRLSDRAGRKPLIVVGRAGIFIYPLIYAFASNVSHLYVAEFIIGILGSVSDIAIFAYLLDITTEEQRGASVAVYNMLIGFSTFFGSILGGYLVGFFSILGLDPASSMKASYLVSSAGRLVSGLLFLRISEEYVYPSNVRKELIGIMTEDIERTRYGIRKAEEMGEKAESDLREDMEKFESTTNMARKLHEDEKKQGTSDKQKGPGNGG